jgi:hypothetical protein
VVNRIFLIVGLSFSYAQSFEKVWPTWQDESDAVIRVYDDAGNVIHVHEQAGDFKEPSALNT